MSTSQDSSATAGGATKTASVGSSLAGSGSAWMSTRSMTRGRIATQKSTPTPKATQASSTEPTDPAASGVTMLPTTGMNQAGVIWAAPMSPRPAHAVSTRTVASRCPTAPTHHRTVARAGAISA